ncbi:MAG: putative Ig domain-containing protein, partial [Terriglobales bacterium]
TKTLPNAGTNVAYSQQLVAIGGVINPPTTNYTWSLTGDSSLPPNLSLSSSGLISGTPTTAGTYSFTVRVADAATPTPHIAQQALSILVIAPLAFTPPAMQTTTVNQVFSEDLSTFTSGGVAPYTYSVISGSPAPFSLVGSIISGTPASPTTSSFTVQVTDSASPAHTAQQAMSIQVVPPLAFAPPAMQTTTTGQPFTENLSTYTSGGAPPYIYSITGGSLAPFSLAGSIISGTPTAAGSPSFTVKVTDTLSNSLSSSQTINIVNPVTINSITPSTAADGIGQTVTIFTSGVPNSNAATATFSQGATSAAGFVFPSPSSANVLYVRLPSGLTTGPANVVVTNTSTSVSSAPFPITVSTTPGTPVENFVMGPADCSGQTGSSITSVSAGEGILLSAYGIDTTGSTVVFSDGTHTIPVTPGCSLSSPTLGLAVVATVPSGLTPGPITVSIQTTVSGVNSALSNALSLNLQAPQGSCQPSSSLSVLVSGTNVVSYVPKGSWEGLATGVSAVNVEGSSVTPTQIPTANIVNSCASNPLTGQTVCTANNTDVYLLTGTTLGSTLTSGGSGSISFSGGSCTNCGVAMDAVHNKAVIGLSVNGGSPGFQFLDLGTSPSFEPAFLSPSGKISEDPLLDPLRNLLLSASETSNYEIIDVSNSMAPAFFENPISPFQELDSSGEDCSTGIALAPAEFSGPSNVFIADLTQAVFTPGLPGTWTAPSQVQSLSESSLSAGASGVAVAQGTHTGIVSGEFGGSLVTAIALPATSGSGTPAITDWVTCDIGNGFSNGLDPHTVTAYQSPNGGHAIAVLANDGATMLAVVDLTMMLNPTIVPRTGGGHGCASTTLPASVVSFVSVP